MRGSPIHWPVCIDGSSSIARTGHAKVRARVQRSDHRFPEVLSIIEHSGDDSPISPDLFKPLYWSLRQDHPQTYDQPQSPSAPRFIAGAASHSLGDLRGARKAGWFRTFLACADEGPRAGPRPTAESSAACVPDTNSHPKWYREWA
jgi:hypothetical protein